MSEETERVVIITGGAAGIGFAISKAFAENGDIVAIVDRDEKHARLAANEIGLKSESYKLDVTDEKNVKFF